MITIPEYASNKTLIPVWLQYPDVIIKPGYHDNVSNMIMIFLFDLNYNWLLMIYLLVITPFLKQTWQW